MTVYWTSTKSPKRMFDRRDYDSPEKEAYLRENSLVCPALLAADLGMNEWRVMSYQRRIGLRSLKGNGSRDAV